MSAVWRGTTAVIGVEALNDVHHVIPQDDVPVLIDDAVYTVSGFLTAQDQEFQSS